MSVRRENLMMRHCCQVLSLTILLLPPQRGALLPIPWSSKAAGSYIPTALRKEPRLLRRPFTKPKRPGQDAHQRLVELPGPG